METHSSLKTRMHWKYITIIPFLQTSHLIEISCHRKSHFRFVLGDDVFVYKQPLITMYHLRWVPPTSGLINRTKQIDHCLYRSPINSLILEHFKNMKFFFTTVPLREILTWKCTMQLLHCDYKEDQCSF